MPLTTLPQQQAGNSNTSAPPTAPNNSVSTPNPVAQTQIQPAAQPSSRSRTWRDRLGDTVSTANGIGTFALITALVFGIGAWVGMKIQISQGAQNMDLAIWTACADHQVRLRIVFQCLPCNSALIVYNAISRRYKIRPYVNQSWLRTSLNSGQEMLRRSTRTWRSWSNVRLLLKMKIVFWTATLVCSQV